jgi:hypothetical protein
MSKTLSFICLFLSSACNIESRIAAIRQERLKCDGNPYYDIVSRSGDPPSVYLGDLRKSEKQAADNCPSGVMRKEDVLLYVEDFCDSQGCTTRTRFCYSCVSPDDPLLNK